MDQDIEKVYSYVTSWWRLLFAIVLGVALGVFATHTALNNEVGLIINGLVELGVTGATIFWWCLAGIMWLIPIFGVIGIVDKVKGSNRIAITAEGVLLPNPVWKQGEAYVPFRSVVDLSLRTVKKVRFLTIRAAGKSYAIVSNRFSRPEDFDEFVRTVADRSPV